MTPVRILIFAKAPQPGFAKTRLIPALGSQGAAELAHRMLEHTIQQALAAAIGPVELCVTPGLDEPAWSEITFPPGIVWSDQGTGDLGERLARATQRVIDAGESVLLIGTDCPELDAKCLSAAASALEKNDAILIPATDGGYVLLGLNQFHASLFEGIAWSTATVAFETLCRIGVLRWQVQSHPMLHDIDEAGDLKWLPKTWQTTSHA